MEQSTFAQRLIHRLNPGATETDAAARALGAIAERAERFRPDEVLARRGTLSERAFLIVDGFGYRYRILRDGQRSITGFLLAGDFCGAPDLMCGQLLDSSIGALSPLSAATLSRAQILELESNPSTSRALARSALIEMSIAREWISNIGHRSALERTAHLLCELFERLQVMGHTRGFEFELPLLQPQLADALAMTAIELNRSLMEAKRLGLCVLRDRHLMIWNYAGLRTAAGFDAGYLQLPPRGVGVPGSMELALPAPSTAHPQPDPVSDSDDDEAEPPP